MARHRIHDQDGEETKLFWQDDDGDSHEHQKVFRETPYGGKRVNGAHYNPDTGEFHDA